MEEGEKREKEDVTLLIPPFGCTSTSLLRLTFLFLFGPDLEKGELHMAKGFYI